ncbi:MAG: hypothetical protein ABW252_01625 [Polyangiales bacterium]
MRSLPPLPAALAAILLTVGAARAGADAHPATADRGGATQHGDAAASDTSPLPGPGVGPLRVASLPLLAACPSVLFGRDDLLVAVCTQILNQTPAVFLLHPDDGRVLTSLPLRAGASLLGGVYPYLDHEDRLVVVDGQQTLLRIAHLPDGLGGHRLEVASRASLAELIPADDTVVGLIPDRAGRVWLATTAGRVLVVEPDGSAPRLLALPAGERIANSIASAPAGVAVVTDRALYVVDAGPNQPPSIVWRATYARGLARKPGKLSHGSGSTPTFFGPRTGGEYLTIADDAEPLEQLHVFDARSGALHCTVPLPDPTGRGSENSPIGAGSSVWVASTYGYPYPALPAGAGASVPASAPLGGGLTRVDVRDDGCEVVWTAAVRSAAVPKLSLPDGLIYTVERTPIASDGSAGPLDAYDLVAFDADSGLLRARHPLGAGALSDTMQLAGTLAPGRVIYQGTLAGILRIAPR